MLCGGRRRRHGCWKPTGHWTNTASRLTPGSFSPPSTSCCACNCPTWSTWRSRSIFRTASSRLCPTSAKPSVSGTWLVHVTRYKSLSRCCWKVEILIKLKFWMVCGAAASNATAWEFLCKPGMSPSYLCFNTWLFVVNSSSACKKKKKKSHTFIDCWFWSCALVSRLRCV